MTRTDDRSENQGSTDTMTTSPEVVRSTSLGLTPTRARVILAVWLGSIVACVLVACSKDRGPGFEPPPGATSDIDVYERIVARVRAGEGYYPAAQNELRTHGYPTRSVFNWRLPTYAWFLGALPSGAWGRAILAALALAAVVLVSTDLLREGGPAVAALGGLACFGALAWGFGERTYLFTEVWAGVLIVLSVAALRRHWTTLGIVCGLAALAFRELAVPYVVVALGLAIASKRRREAWAWALGLVVGLGFLSAHAMAVLARITPADQAIAGGWVRFGGLRFVLTTARTNLFLMPMPLWCTGLVLPFAVLGLLFWRGETGRLVGLTVVLYLGAFSIVGAAFNYYWGFLYAPLLALAFAQAPAGLGGLLADAGGVLKERRPITNDQ